MVAGILAGLVAFHESWQQQEADSKGFIPT